MEDPFRDPQDIQGYGAGGGAYQEVENGKLENISSIIPPALWEAVNSSAISHLLLHLPNYSS